MNTATSSVEFCFNNTMYKKTDAVAMDSPLGPVLANIFVGYHESLLFDSTTNPCMYQRYVDDSFTIFKTEIESEIFYNKLNLMHPSLKFTIKKRRMVKFHFLMSKSRKILTNF